MNVNLAAAIKWFSALTLAIALAVTVVGCSSSSSLNEGDDLRVDLASEPATLDPGLQYDTSSYSVYRNIFDQLLRRNIDTKEIEPWIAKSWERKSPTSWEFTIRDGVKFTNGESLTAKDAAFSLNRILGSELNSPQVANYSTVESAKGSGNVLTITTAEPSPTLLDQLVNLSIVPEDYVKKVGAEEFNLKPIGSGAYKLEEWNQGNSISLSTNQDYWGEKPEIPGAVFRFVPNGASRIADLQSGQAHLVLGISPDDVTQIESNDTLKVLSGPTERVAYLAFNTVNEDAPMSSSKELRQAVALGIDYQAIIDSLLKGYGERVDVVLTPESFGYPEDIEGYSYDPETAKELLKKSGYADGVTLEFATSPNYPQTVVQAIQADLKEIGIKVNIVSTDQATYLQKIQDPARKWGDIRFGQWSCACLDADGTIYPLFYSDSVWSSFSNKKYDKLVEAAGTTRDEDKRKELYNEAFQVLQEEMPGVGLWQVESIYGATTNLQWKPDVQESFFIQDMGYGG